MVVRNSYNSERNPLEEKGVYMEGKDDIINLISSRADEREGGHVEGKHEYFCLKCCVDFASRD
jgi:hypothetical protein